MNEAGTEETNVMRSTLRNGKVCYIEIPAVDITLQSAFMKRFLAGNSDAEAMAACLLMTVLAR